MCVSYSLMSTVLIGYYLSGTKYTQGCIVLSYKCCVRQTLSTITFVSLSARYSPLCKLMGYKEAAVIIVNSFLIHLYFTFDIRSFFLSNELHFSTQTVMNVSIGIAFLLFPLFGLVADVWLTRYKMILTSLFSLTSFLTFGLLISLFYYIILQGNMNTITPPGGIWWHGE